MGIYGPLYREICHNLSLIGQYICTTVNVSEPVNLDVKVITSAVVGMLFPYRHVDIIDLDIDMHVDIIRVSKSNETLAEKW